MYQRQVPYFSRERLLAIQQKNMFGIIQHAYRTVPFYRNFMMQHRLKPEDFRTIADLARFPLVDRMFVSDNVSLFQSEDFNPKNCVAMHSGTGRTTYWDQASFLNRLAYNERERVVWLHAGHLKLGHQQLYVMPSASSVFTTRGTWDRQVETPRFIVKRHFFDAMEPYGKLVELLATLQPEMVFCYGSYLEQFARFLHDRGICPFMPKVWGYGADSLSTYWRDVIEKEYACVVLSHYSTTDVGRIGYECVCHSGFHLYVDLLTLRLIRADGTPATLGEIGEVVVSNLMNRATVLLNYRLGDLAELTDQGCPCGRTLPLLRNLHGRIAEVVQVNNETMISSTTLLGKFAKELENALNVQVVSAVPGRIIWRIVPSTNLDRAGFQLRLLARWKEVFGETCCVAVEFVDAISTTPAGKFQRVVRAAQKP
jgi:phenylacetate-CoA ligase